MGRIGEISRNTKENRITVRIDLDGTGKSEICTGIGFFDHMLEGFARHGLFDLTVHAEGDLHVDDHHTVEDTGIVLGQAIAAALGDKAGICRYGDRILSRLISTSRILPFFGRDIRLRKKAENGNR